MTSEPMGIGWAQLLVAWTGTQVRTHEVHVLRRCPQRSKGVVRDFASDRQEAEDAAAAVVNQHHLQCTVGVSRHVEAGAPRCLIHEHCRVTMEGRSMSRVSKRMATRFLLGRVKTPDTVTLPRTEHVPVAQMQAAAHRQRRTQLCGAQQVQAVDVVEEGHVADHQRGSATEALSPARRC